MRYNGKGPQRTKAPDELAPASDRGRRTKRAGSRARTLEMRQRLPAHFQMTAMMSCTSLEESARVSEKAELTSFVAPFFAKALRIWIRGCCRWNRQPGFCSASPLCARICTKLFLKRSKARLKPKRPGGNFIECW